MKTNPPPGIGDRRDQLVALLKEELQESDPDRELDSLEVMVALTVLYEDELDVVPVRATTPSIAELVDYLLSRASGRRETPIAPEAEALPDGGAVR